MTEVHFYTGVADKTLHACRLVRQAIERGRKVVAYASDHQALARFDTALWTFDPISFVPHAMLGDPLAERTPVVLTTVSDTDNDGLSHHEVLFNLDGETPRFFSRFDLLIEFVGLEADDVAAGRARWKFYAERGYRMHHRPQDA
ncbi:MAG TPA: DNA polymerase III subunit chi [Burkholderiaceae bacterium]|nr:DNA polymerase III subunit chi [Burkholderiaceae bacterium]